MFPDLLFQASIKEMENLNFPEKKNLWFVLCSNVTLKLFLDYRGSPVQRPSAVITWEFVGSNPIALWRYMCERFYNVWSTLFSERGFLANWLVGEMPVSESRLELVQGDSEPLPWLATTHLRNWFCHLWKSMHLVCWELVSTSWGVEVSVSFSVTILIHLSYQVHQLPGQ